MYADRELKTLPATAGKVTGSEVGDHPTERRHRLKGTAVSLESPAVASATLHVPFLLPRGRLISAASNDKPPIGSLFIISVILYLLPLLICIFNILKRDILSKLLEYYYTSHSRGLKKNEFDTPCENILAENINSLFLCFFSLSTLTLSSSSSSSRSVLS